MTPQVMGVLNVTPDSFSDGGRFLDVDAAVEHGLAMAAAGAAVVDVGGESTRPGAAPVAAEEEARRVVPVVEALAGRVRVSVDTAKREVAEAAIAAGATVLNDISSSLYDVAAAAGSHVAYVAMHMRGTPATMQTMTDYDDVVEEVAAYLAAKAQAAQEAGVAEVYVDPGLGFAKSAEHNLLLLRHLRRLTALGHPVLVGASRKSFLGLLTGNAPADDRLEASVAVAVYAAAHGAAMLRVHDVKETADAMRLLGKAA